MERQNYEDFIEALYQRMNDLVNDDLNDECACALLNVLSQGQIIFYHASSKTN